MQGLERCNVVVFLFFFLFCFLAFVFLLMFFCFVFFFFSKSSHSYLDLKPSNLKVELAQDITQHLWEVIFKYIDKCRQ